MPSASQKEMIIRAELIDVGQQFCCNNWIKNGGRLRAKRHPPQSSARIVNFSNQTCYLTLRWRVLVLYRFSPPISCPRSFRICRSTTIAWPNSCRRTQRCPLKKSRDGPRFFSRAPPSLYFKAVRLQTLSDASMDTDSGDLLQNRSPRSSIQNLV